MVLPAQADDIFSSLCLIINTFWPVKSYANIHRSCFSDDDHNYFLTISFLDYEFKVTGKSYLEVSLAMIKDIFDVILVEKKPSLSEIKYKEIEIAKVNGDKAIVFHKYNNAIHYLSTLENIFF